MKRAAGRILLALLFLCAVVSAQAGSFVLHSSHHHSSHHCCLRCHGGPLPSLPITASVACGPVVATAWLAEWADAYAAQQVLLTVGCSRAPPE